MENGNTATDTKKPTETAEDYFGYKAKDMAGDTAVAPSTGKDFEAEVNKLIKETKVTDEGKFEFPDGIEPWAKVAIANEKKFRDTQGKFTSGQQELKALKAENEALLQRLSGQVQITSEQAK